MRVCYLSLLFRRSNCSKIATNQTQCIVDPDQSACILDYLRTLQIIMSQSKHNTMWSPSLNLCINNTMGGMDDFLGVDFENGSLS